MRERKRAAAGRARVRARLRARARIFLYELVGNHLAPSAREPVVLCMTHGGFIKEFISEPNDGVAMLLDLLKVRIMRGTDIIGSSISDAHYILVN